ncbi:hypothetical protein I4F81_002979 [Pyropia yezoensis]|uniref:Uncharacterized protein n=1 Tax=Pyropia yezoensis TaxID=2788 RepID=A0ACC3BRN1_PYRYE|nr:hypothetical protein I4F81_002979 [Neopyropia yezoensis]
MHAAPMVESSRGRPAIASGHPTQPPTPPPPFHRLQPAAPTDTALPSCTAAATAHATGVPTATNTPPLPPDCPLNVARPHSNHPLRSGLDAGSPHRRRHKDFNIPTTQTAAGLATPSRGGNNCRNGSGT